MYTHEMCVKASRGQGECGKPMSMLPCICAFQRSSFMDSAVGCVNTCGRTPGTGGGGSGAAEIRQYCTKCSAGRRLTAGSSVGRSAVMSAARAAFCFRSCSACGDSAAGGLKREEMPMAAPATRGGCTLKSTRRSARTECDRCSLASSFPSYRTNRELGSFSRPICCLRKHSLPRV